MKLKTLKTLTLEAVMTYLYERDKQVHIVVDWTVLDALKGHIEYDRTKAERGITLDISPNAVRNFEIVENLMIFNIKFSGIDCQCFVPTASVAAIFEKGSENGFQYNTQHDLHVELNEASFEGPEIKEKVKAKTKPSFLSVVK